MAMNMEKQDSNTMKVPFFKVLGIALLGGFITLGGYKALEYTIPAAPEVQAMAYVPSSLPTQLASNVDLGPAGSTDLTFPAALATPAVVHVKSNMMVQTRSYNDPFGGLFGDPFGRSRPQQRSMQSSGSGVITTPDGYIVTNNHVVNDAQSVEVVLEDGRTYPAQVIGTDPSTDLAMLKIEEKQLPVIEFGDSDELKIGEWVLAVGNPFNLTSTVTAGIVSAKARNINILKDRLAIESFIQTDAAVNPGNSGGALVNANGKLVGINTAIASRTGSYSGYSFAVPVEIVKKVINDLMNHGVVQRAFLGADMIELNGDVAKKLGTDQTHGVYIESVLEGASADRAGLQPGDIILGVDGKELRNSAELSEYLGRQRPGDKVELGIQRAKKQLIVPVELRNSKGTTDVVKRNDGELLSSLGVELSELSKSDLNNYGLRGGLQIKKVGDGKIKQFTDIQAGFIITSIDRQVVTSPAQLEKVLRNKSGGVMIEGIYPDRPGMYYYAFGM